MSGPMNPVGWFEIYVADIERAKTFYSSVLGGTFHQLMPDSTDMWAFGGEPTNAGATGALVKHAMRGPSLEGTLVYFACAHCGETAEKAVAAGGKVMMPRTSIGPFGFIAIIGDTEGNAVGLHSMG